MKKFIKICKAILPQFFRLAHWHLSFRCLQTAYFLMLVNLKSHAIKHNICVYELPKLHLHLSTCSSYLGDAESGVPGRFKPGPDANNALPRIPADA